MSRRSIAISHRSYILGALVAEAGYWKNRAEDERDLDNRVSPYTRGRLSSIRYGVFVAALATVLAFFGLYRSTASDKGHALFRFVIRNRDRFRNADLRNHKSATYGAYSAWRELGNALVSETVAASNASSRTRREAAAV